MQIKKRVKNLAASFCNSLYQLLITGRAAYLKRSMKLGNNVFIRPPLNVFYPENVTIEENVSINSGTTILAHDKVSIGSYTMIATNVSIITVNHDYSKIGKEAQRCHKTAPVNIGKNVWIGANAIILPGVTIEEGAVIGAGSVVSDNIPAYTIAVGIPAKPIKNRIIENSAPADKI